MQIIPDKGFGAANLRTCELAIISIWFSRICETPGMMMRQVASRAKPQMSQGLVDFSWL
jgi:hypothetical protein